MSAAQAGALAGAVAVGRGGAATSDASGGDANADGGAATSDALASNDGNTYSSEHRSANFYVSRSLPSISNECGLSADAGGGEDGKAGFLGIQWLSHVCMMNGLAREEDNAELKALLKCESRWYRNAVAFDQPRKDRQAYCVMYVKTIHIAEIDERRKQLVAQMAHELELAKAQLPGK